MLPTWPMVARQLEVDAAGLARREPDLAPVPFLGHHLGADAGRAAHLRAARDLELDVVDRGAERDEPQRQVVARLDVGVARRQHGVADLQPVGAEDVALLAVRVVQERDARRAVRIVLDARHLGGDAELVAAEVDDPEAALVATAPEARGDATVVVAAARPGQRRGERLLRACSPARARRSPGRRGRGVPGVMALCGRRPMLRPLRRTRCSGRRRSSRRPSSSWSACRRTGPCASPCRARSRCGPTAR